MSDQAQVSLAFPFQDSGLYSFSDGAELFYLRTPVGPPEELFAWSFYDQNLPHHRHAVLPDGRFLMIESDVRQELDSPYDLIVVQNWHHELERHVPVE